MPEHKTLQLRGSVRWSGGGNQDECATPAPLHIHPGLSARLEAQNVGITPPAGQRPPDECATDRAVGWDGGGDSPRAQTGVCPAAARTPLKPARIPTACLRIGPARAGALGQKQGMRSRRSATTFRSCSTLSRARTVPGRTNSAAGIPAAAAALASMTRSPTHSTLAGSRS